MYKNAWKEKGQSDLVYWQYDIIKVRKSKQAYELSCERPLNKQAGYHITNIYLTLLQKVFCRGVRRGGSCFRTPFG